MPNAQEWLDKNYPREGVCKEENNFKNKNFGKKRSEITKLDISKKDLTGSLTLVEFSNLTGLDCSNNQLTDLTIFSKLVNLEGLFLSDNPLTGSLEPLQNLTKLTELWIQNTNPEKGLEYLPASLERIYCTDQLAEQLTNYKVEKYYNYQSWRKDHLQLITKCLYLWNSIKNKRVKKRKSRILSN